MPPECGYFQVTSCTQLSDILGAAASTSHPHSWCFWFKRTLKMCSALHKPQDKVWCLLFSLRHVYLWPTLCTALSMKMDIFWWSLSIEEFLDAKGWKNINSGDDMISRENGTMKKQSKPTMFHIETAKDALKRNNFSISQFALNSMHKG